MVFRNHRTLAMMVMLAIPAVCVSTSFGEDAAPGVVRISDNQPAQPIIIPVQHQVYQAAAPQQVMQANWNSYGSYHSYGSGIQSWGCDDHCRPHRNRRQAFGFGLYDITYAVNPYYQDPRDTRVYSAQGWGVPMAVPLAPVVGNTYNYGWGMPSSRMTPISRPVRYPW